MSFASADRNVAIGHAELLQHKLRAALTMLGVLFGVSSVVAMLAIGEGASWEAQEQIRQLGSTNILIRSVKPQEDGEPTTKASASSFMASPTTISDRIQQTISDIQETVPIRELRVEVRAGTRVVNPRINRHAAELYAKSRARHLDEGRFICDDDHVGAANICILGSDVARVLFPFESPLEKVVKIGPEAFRVVGTCPPARRRPRPAAAAKDIEGEVFMPLRTLRRWFGSITAKIGRARANWSKSNSMKFLAKATDIDRVEAVAKAVREVVGRYHDERKRTTKL